MLSRMEQMVQMVDVAHTADLFNQPTDKPTKPSDNLFLQLMIDVAAVAATKVRNDKNADSEALNLVPAIFSDLDNAFHFGPIIANVADALSKQTVPPDVAKAPATDIVTQTTVNDMQAVFDKYKHEGKWNGHSPFTVTIGDFQYVGGLHGEMYVHNKTTGVDTLKTSDKPDATVITKAKNGDVHGFTSQYSFTTIKEADGKRLLTITTNTQPPESISLIENGNGFEVPNPSDSKHPLLLQRPEDIAKFDFLVKHLIAGNGQYTELDLLEDFKLSWSDLQTKFTKIGQPPPTIGTADPLDPLTLSLGDGKHGPTAKFTASDGTPISSYDFSTGDTSILGIGAAADFVFHDGYDVPTTGIAITLAVWSSAINSGTRSAEQDAQIIDSAISLAMAIAQQFQYTSSMDQGTALAILDGVNSILGSLGPAGALPQSTVASCIAMVNEGLKNLEKQPDWSNTLYRSDVLHGITII